MSRGKVPYEREHELGRNGPTRQINTADQHDELSQAQRRDDIPYSAQKRQTNENIKIRSQTQANPLSHIVSAPFLSLLHGRERVVSVSLIPK